MDGAWLYLVKADFLKNLLHLQYMSRFLVAIVLAGGYYAAMCEPPTGNRTAQSRGQIFFATKTQLETQRVDQV